MTTLEEIKQQESALKYKLENTKRIDERRALRKELRELRDRKDKLVDENGNLRNPSENKTVASKFSMKVGGTRNQEGEKPPSRFISTEPPIKKAAQETRTTTSKYSFQMNSNKDTVDNKPGRYGVNSRNEDNDRGKENEGKEKAPTRMSRRASLAELFKLESGAPSKPVAKPVETVRPQIVVPPSARSTPDSDRDAQTKYDLIKNISRLRCRRRSVRDIQTQNSKEELDGLMYVKSGGAVKLVSTTEGEEQAKEQRRIRRVSRKESADKINIQGGGVSLKAENDLHAVPEERSPPQVKSAGFNRPAPKTQPGNFGISYGSTSRPGPDSRKYEPPQPRPSSTSYQRGRPEPKSFLSNGPTQPKKLGGGGGGPFGSGSVADRMAFFRKAADDEAKAKQKQFTPPPKPAPTPTPLSPTSPASPTPPSPTSPTGKVSLKKAPDPNRTPRDLKKKPPLKRQMSVSSMVLEWCKDVTRGYNGVNITNFSGSFANGLAFCALIHKFNPDKYDFDSLTAENREHNFRLAFETGSAVGVPALLDVEDMVRMKKPEPRSVQCYVQMIFSKYRPKDMDMSNLTIA